MDGNDAMHAEGNDNYFVAGEGADALSAEGTGNDLFGDCYTCAGGDDTIDVVGDSARIFGQNGNDALSAVGNDNYFLARARVDSREFGAVSRAALGCRSWSGGAAATAFSLERLWT